MTPVDLDRLWDFDDAAASERRFTDALRTANLPEPMRIEALTQLARAQGLQRKFDVATATLHEAETGWRAHQPAHTRGWVRILLERGRVLNSSGHSTLSRPFFEEAWRLGSHSGGESLAIDAAHMLAIVESPQQQIEWAQRGIAMAEEARDPAARRWLGALLNNLGWTMHDAGRFDEALRLFTRALAFHEAQGNRAGTLIARWTVARTLRSLHRHLEALELQRALLAEHQRDGTRDAYVAEELGECLLALGKPSEAQTHFAEAWRVLSQNQSLRRNDAQRLARLKKLADA